MWHARLAILALVVASVTTPLLSTHTASAKGDFYVDITPEEVDWGGTVWLTGESARADRQFEVWPQFSTERPDGGITRPESPILVTPGAGGTFRVPLDLRSGIPGMPDDPQPGWLAFSMHELVGGIYTGDLGTTLIVVTSDGNRPLGAGFISGRVQNMQPDASLFMVWSPVNDPDAYRYRGMVQDGLFRTDFVDDGDYFVGIYDVSEGWHAAGPDVQTVTGYSRELSSEITLAGRLVTVSDGQPVQDITFQLAPGPGPADGAIVVSTSTASPARPAGTSSASSTGWLAPALLGAGSVALLGVSLLSRRRRRGLPVSAISK
jgi:hypothetical protein